MTTKPPMSPETEAGEAIEAAAKVAETWKSSLRPGDELRLLGHQEAARAIATAIRALKDRAAVAPEVESVLAFYADEARWQMNSSGITSALDDRGFRAREALVAMSAKPVIDAPADPSLPPADPAVEVTALARELLAAEYGKAGMTEAAWYTSEDRGLPYSRHTTPALAAITAALARSAPAPSDALRLAVEKCRSYLEFEASAHVYDQDAKDAREMANMCDAALRLPEWSEDGLITETHRISDDPPLEVPDER